ncbi:MAG TPA: helix-turn-helix transcriptional regulator [Candidatus Paenibacillus intestinavium]|nr:helix-turn-helix transcriptional regulator [Candidatus Paenibacillus intestinavium]
MQNAFKSKLFRKFLSRYLLIIGVSGLVLLTTNIISLTNTFSRLTENTHKFMAHTTELLDNRMLDLQKLTIFISSNSKLLPYQLQELVTYPHLISDELEKLKAPSIDLDSIGIFYRNSSYPALENVIFTDTGMYSPESYVELVGEDRIVVESFNSILQQLDSPVLLSSLSDENNQGSKDQVLLYLVPLGSTPYSSGIIVYKLNYASLLQNFERTIDNESNLIVFDRHSTPIVYWAGDPKLEYSELENMARYQKPENSEPANDEHHSKVSNPSYLLLQETSEKQKFHVVNAIRRSTYYHEFYVALTTSLGVILLSLVLGLVFSYLFARKSYQPIQELSSSFPSFGLEKSATSDKDELAQLSLYIQKMRDEGIKMSKMINNQEVLSRNHLLQALLMGKLNVNNTKEANRNHLQKYFGKRETCSVIIIMFDDYNTKVGKEPLKEQWLLKYVICNVFENFSGEHGIHYSLDLAVDNGIVGIVSWSNDCAEEWEERSHTFAKQILAFMQRHFSCSLSCSVGELQPAEDLHMSFNSAIMLAEYRIFAGKQSIMMPSEVAQQRAAHLEEDRRKVSDLVIDLNVAVSSRDPKKLQQLIEEMEKYFVLLEDASSFRTAYLQIVFSLNQFVNNIPLAYREAIKYKLESLAENQLETVEEACAGLLHAAYGIQDSLGEESSDDRLYSAMLEYVAENYMDYNLSLSMVAEKLSLTPSYVTRYFKNKNGLPLMQFVSKVRIDKAKEMLENSNLTIKEIVEQIGFVDENNFSRAFRKREGISPSKYRAVRQ